MAKEYEKFLADYKKLKSAYGELSEDAKAKTSQRYRLASSNLSEGEANLRSALTKARKAGVTGDSFGDFAKNKDFQEAIKLLNIAVDDLDKEIEAVDAMAEAATEGLAKYGALNTAITKDLSKRKDNSESKKDIEELGKKVVADGKVLQSVAKMAASVSPYSRGYGKSFQKKVAEILKEDSGGMTTNVEGNELPQLLVDRVIKRNFSLCVVAAKTVKELCESALDKDGKDNRSGAVSDVKEATEKHKELAAIAADYVKIKVKYSEDIKVSKDSKFILETIDKMKQLDEGAERQIRSAVGAFKKVG